MHFFQPVLILLTGSKVVVVLGNGSCSYVPLLVPQSCKLWRRSKTDAVTYVFRIVRGGLMGSALSLHVCGGNRVAGNFNFFFENLWGRHYFSLNFLLRPIWVHFCYDVGLPLVFWKRSVNFFAALPKLTMPLRDPAWRIETTNDSSTGERFCFRKLPNVTQNRLVARVRNIFRHTDGYFAGTGNLRGARGGAN